MGGADVIIRITSSHGHTAVGLTGWGWWVVAILAPPLMFWRR